MPPPPPPGPPPGPPPPMPASSNKKSGGGGGADRNMLLSDIRTGARLKKTVTNDRSAPVIDAKPGAAGGVKPLAPPSGGGAASNGSGPPQLGGLFAGGMPTLRPTGRGGARPGVGRAPSVEAPSPPSQSAKSGRGPVTSPAARGAPPQPPPANRKPSLVGAGNDATDNAAGRLTSNRKPNLAPKPPPAPEATPTPAKKPSPPPKSPSVASLTNNNSVLNLQSIQSIQSVQTTQTTPPPPPPPPSAKPNVARAHSLRSLKQMAPGIPDDEPAFNRSATDISNKASPPPPPPNRFATLPRNALSPGGAPRGPLPAVPRSNGAHSPKGQSSRPPTAPPPPPPARANPPTSVPPAPPLSAPPPPPHRASPAPPPPSSVAASNGHSKPELPPPPPTRGASMRTNGSASSLIAPPTSKSTNEVADDFESRFASRFRPLNHLPSPEAFADCHKIYPSQLSRASMKRQQAPPPPVGVQSAPRLLA